MIEVTEKSADRSGIYQPLPAPDQSFKTFYEATIMQITCNNKFSLLITSYIYYINLIYADFSQKAIPLPAAVRWKEGYTLEMLSAY